MLQPAERVPRKKFGVVGPFPLQLGDLPALVFPDTTLSERLKLLEGLTFFTTPHTAGQGLGPINNQPFCLGCHTNTAEAVRSPGLLSQISCFAGSPCVSHVARAARSTPTNFGFTSLNPATGGGRPADTLDAINNTGRTAAFTIFGDFDPSHMDATSNPTGIGFFDPLDGATTQLVTGMVSQPFGGQVQHARPAVDAMRAGADPARWLDANLTPRVPSIQKRGSTHCFRRSVGERAGPPYIGRGLMEAVPTQDITGICRSDIENGNSSLGNFASELGARSDRCIPGKANMIPRTFTANLMAPSPALSGAWAALGCGQTGWRFCSLSSAACKGSFLSPIC